MDDRFLEDLKDRIDIVEVIRKYAELKKAGKNYMCRSPFRNERTPSFCVSPEKQFWYDFGVSEGGDVISFLEKMENISFPEAVEMIADMVGVEVPKNLGREKSTSKEEKKDIFALHEKACSFFERELEKNEAAKKYLAHRGISHAIQKNWRIGYGGDVADGLTKFLFQEGFSAEQISQSGVAFERKFGDKTMRDRFFKRLMIPICEPREGKIIAFSGRDLSGEKNTAKYVNSPENPVYHKSATLFGLDRARKVIREHDAVILVEGNFDVISAHSGGITHTVATCGTSLTEEHLRILKRLTKNFYLAFDSDIAGKKATLRAVEMTLQLELNPFIIDIKDAKDIDELAQKNSAALKKCVAEAQNALLFLLDRFAQKNMNGSIEGEKKFLDAIFYFLRIVHRPVEVDEILTKISEKIKRPKSIIENEFATFQRKNPITEKKKREMENTKRITREESFVGFLSANWKYFSEKITEKVVHLLSGMPQELLTKKIKGEPLNDTEKNILQSWEISQELLYHEDTPEEILRRDAKIFIDTLAKESQKKARLEEALSVKKNFEPQGAHTVTTVH